jgi:uncharacterized damage-inducible protein DinB
MSRLEMARDQIVLARRYTLRLLEDLQPGDWFRQPTEGITHIAWQVGHLAMAQYRLLLLRMRGERPNDQELISADFLAKFGQGTAPDRDPAKYPPIREIRQVFDHVFRQACEELPSYTDVELDQPPVKPHPLFETKLGSLTWCARHEMMHAGQIGLLRRLLGKPPQW